MLASYPLVTYVFGTTGESSLKKAFADQGLEPNVVFTARDADIIKTYVRMGMGVGIVAPMAYECQDRKDLTALSAAGLFPRVTTWLGFRRDAVSEALHGGLRRRCSRRTSRPTSPARPPSCPTQADVDRAV